MVAYRKQTGKGVSRKCQDSASPKKSSKKPDLIEYIVNVTAQGVHPAAPQTPLGSAFTYQGQIKRGGGSFSDPTCQMVFGLYDNASAGNQVGSPISTTVPVMNGLFTVELNAAGEFGPGAFMGDAR